MTENFGLSTMPQSGVETTEVLSTDKETESHQIIGSDENQISNFKQSEPNNLKFGQEEVSLGVANSKVAKNKRRIINQNINKFFLSDTKKRRTPESKEEQDENLKLLDDNSVDEGTLEIKPKKLKKVGQIAKEKVIKRKIKKLNRQQARDLFADNEAEMGSDNEEHDDFIKNPYSEDSELELDREEEFKEINNEEEEVEGLIDKQYGVGLSKRELLKTDGMVIDKFYDDMLKDDKAMLKKIINFDHNKRKNKYLEEDLLDADPDYIPIQERMKLSGRDNEDILNSKDQAFRIQLLSQPLKKSKNENNADNYMSSENEESRALKSMREDSLIKKFAEKNPANLEQFRRQIKENNLILANNSINLNKIVEETKVIGYLDKPDSFKSNNKNLCNNQGVFYCKTNSLLFKHGDSGLFGGLNKSNSNLTGTSLSKSNSSVSQSNKSSQPPNLSRNNSKNYSLSTLWANSYSTSADLLKHKRIKCVLTPQKCGNSKIKDA